MNDVVYLHGKLLAIEALLAAALAQQAMATESPGRYLSDLHEEASELLAQAISEAESADSHSPVDLKRGAMGTLDTVALFAAQHLRKGGS